MSDASRQDENEDKTRGIKVGAPLMMARPVGYIAPLVQAYLAKAASDGASSVYGPPDESI